MRKHVVKLGAMSDDRAREHAVQLRLSNVRGTITERECATLYERLELASHKSATGEYVKLTTKASQCSRASGKIM